MHKIKVILIIFLLAGFIKYIKTEQSSFDIDINKKVMQAKQLVNDAVEHLNKVTVAQACSDFIYNPEWRKGEIFVFMFNENGIVLAAGDNSSSMIWKSTEQSLHKLEGEDSLFKQMLNIGPKGRFIGYILDQAYKSSFVRVVKKNGMKYIIGAGFYPDSHRYVAKQILLHAIQYLHQYGAQEAFTFMSSPVGPFIKGDIYIEAYDFDGVCVANTRHPSLVGQNLIGVEGSRGIEIVKRVIDIASTKGKGVVNYYPNGELKRVFVMQGIDKKTKKPYAITAGYYPNEALSKVESFVNRAIAYIKENGADKAFSDFTNPVGGFVKGGLAIYAYDLEGKCLANGYQPELVGRNLINYKDFRGHLFVKEILENANKNGEAIYPVDTRNSSQTNYFKKIDVPDGKFVIGSSYFPESKKQIVETLLGQAKEHLQKTPSTQAFRDFSRKDGIFLHGDVSIFVYNADGVRLVNGVHKDQIWLNFTKTIDQNGREIVSNMISTGLNGGGWLDYYTRNENRKVCVTAVTKNNALGNPVTFIIGSGYFL